MFASATAVQTPVTRRGASVLPAIRPRAVGSRKARAQADHADATRTAAERVRAEVRSLDRLVDRYRTEASTLGYFAAVYREMTASVLRCLESGAGSRHVTYPSMMADFIQIFAKRYTDALCHPAQATECWQLALGAGDAPLVLHLLTSMNAHIRLDLGLALAEATRTDLACKLFRSDFDIINKLVSGYDPADVLLGRTSSVGMVHDMSRVLQTISPSSAWLDVALGGLLSTALADRIVLERVHVVDVAHAGIAALQSGRPGAFRELEQRRDQDVARASRVLLERSRWTRALRGAARLFERSPVEIIDALRPPDCSLVAR